MAPALAGLATGDLGSMAQNMQVAFATTVVGLVAGAIGYFSHTLKQRWFREDMRTLEYINALNEQRTQMTQNR
jgi:biopolymer transport protein ExbB/TolQ